jgi:hypothetical protein
MDCDRTAAIDAVGAENPACVSLGVSDGAFDDANTGRSLDSVAFLTYYLLEGSVPMVVLFNGVMVQ